MGAKEEVEVNELRRFGVYVGCNIIGYVGTLGWLEISHAAGWNFWIAVAPVAFLMGILSSNAARNEIERLEW